ncbi:MAG TPA: EamA family transporter [Actinomycetota bacterium]|nr:EamA family transporter [Actinomycetota bacterium]
MSALDHVGPTSKKGNLTMLIALILLSVTLAAVAQLTLKHGMNAVNDDLGPARFGLDARSLGALLRTPAVYTGLFLFGLSALVWLVVLSRASLSFAYPFAALTYVLILLFDLFILDETVPPLRWAGVAFIVAGIFLVSRTPHA